jgi:GNAT superfamily N-acetyltransferase
MRTKVTVTYLEMTDPGQLRPSRISRPELEVRQARVPCPELNRFFYTAVGGDWYWIDRLVWTYDQWQRYLGRPGVETWVAWSAGTPAGYCELEARPESGVEVAYFGLLPQFIGQGIGGFLLTGAVERAWQMGAARVWLHTCTLDHPHALASYCARGFRPFKEEARFVDLPDRPPGPWPGANPTAGQPEVR